MLVEPFIQMHASFNDLSSNWSSAADQRGATKLHLPVSWFAGVESRINHAGNQIILNWLYRVWPGQRFGKGLDKRNGQAIHMSVCPGSVCYWLDMARGTCMGTVLYLYMLLLMSVIQISSLLCIYNTSRVDQSREINIQENRHPLVGGGGGWNGGSYIWFFFGPPSCPL